MYVWKGFVGWGFMGLMVGGFVSILEQTAVHCFWNNW